MITVEDVLSKDVKSKWRWPLKGSKSGLVDVYKTLRLTLGNGSLGMSPLHSGRTHPSYHFRKASDRPEFSRDLAIIYNNEAILKALNNKQYIYLTPLRLFMESPLFSHDRFEYIAVLKREGRIGYCILILGFDALDHGFYSSGYEEYGGYFGLMEVLSDGTTILFDRTLPWDKVKTCRANTTSIRNLFFNEQEIASIGSIIDDTRNSQGYDKNKVYTYRIGEKVP